MDLINQYICQQLYDNYYVKINTH